VGGELLQECRVHQVPGVQDEVGAPEVWQQAPWQRFSAPWYVRVGYYGG
jgi:hypothetical protein